jgi:hypothetical protein
MACGFTGWSLTDRAVEWLLNQLIITGRVTEQTPARDHIEIALAKLLEEQGALWA